jgi:hypothetical protein
LVVLGLGSALACAEEDHNFSAGISIHERVTSRDLGVPIYPGATRHREHDEDHEDSGALTLSLWGNSSQIRIVTLELDTSDSISDVAHFYGDALAAYTPLISCPESASSTERADHVPAHSPLHCGSDRAEAGGVLFKAGSTRDLHVVSIEPAGVRTRIKLVHIVTPFD